MSNIPLYSFSHDVQDNTTLRFPKFISPKNLYSLIIFKDTLDRHMYQIHCNPPDVITVTSIADVHDYVNHGILIDKINRIMSVMCDCIDSASVKMPIGIYVAGPNIHGVATYSKFIVIASYSNETSLVIAVMFTDTLTDYSRYGVAINPFPKNQRHHVGLIQLFINTTDLKTVNYMCLDRQVHDFISRNEKFKWFPDVVVLSYLTFCFICRLDLRFW